MVIEREFPIVRFHLYKHFVVELNLLLRVHVRDTVVDPHYEPNCEARASHLILARYVMGL